MLKPKQINIADSNIGLLGSDLEKQVKLAAAQTEAAWKEIGKKVGMEIWRIEKFKVVPWPKEEYGAFYSGDSYICLNTYKKKGADKLLYDVHFWLGLTTSQDEAGVAAYKTVELDDFLGGAPVQHREVQDHESDLFMSYFPKGIRIYEGGVDSGFKHVTAEEYKPRLLHLKGKRKIRVRQVGLSSKEMNSGDVFILDCGMNLYQWNGKESGAMERAKGAELARAIDDERAGKPVVHVFNEGDKDVPALFWKLLGDAKDVKKSSEGGDDLEASKDAITGKKLFRLSDASGKMTFKQEASGKDVTRKKLDTNDAFILDTGGEVFVWIGLKASKEEKRKALNFAQQYLNDNKLPPWTPISRILESGENETFEASFT
jgi:gelsolin